MAKKWYILQVISGKEKMTVANLESLKKRYIQEGRDEVIFDVRVPEEEVRQIKNGKRSVTKQKMLPGYILIELDIPESVLEVKRICGDIVMTNGVAAFVGVKEGRPIPVDDEELMYIFEKMGEATVKSKPVVSRLAVHISFQEGDMVRIVEGPFRGNIGGVDHVDAERKKVRVKIEIFGSPTPVELDVIQVEKI